MLQLWNTLDEAIYYVVAVQFGSPDDRHEQSRAFKGQMEPLPRPVKVGEELEQYDGSDSVSQRRYQVFLSFRGEDTRHNFTSHLLKALKNCGIEVFFDEEKLEKGEELSPTLLNAIAASKVSIIILSKNYASSKSCLTELSKIMECRLTEGQVVLPIFYKVNPFDVRHHTGSFEESFRRHLIKKPKEVDRWNAALTQAGELKGWHIDGGIFDRSETEYIKGIVEVVIKALSSESTSVSEELVGIDDQMKKILWLIEREHIRAIGIWGMGGIGKTTLAEAVYNKVLSCSNKFDAHYFLQNVRERSFQTNGLQSLQHELLSKLLKGDIHIDTPFIGSTLIQDRLRNLRVLVVYDDVYDSDQIKSLGVKYFGPTSKIIVTSRDRQVLKNIGVNELHQVKELNNNDSLQLFSKFAFKQYNPVAGFWDISKKFLDYAGGNPLALKVLGAALYQKSRGEWESALDKLEEYPDQNIFGALKTSYDGLDHLERIVFLDIACIFRGEDKDDVVKLLNRCYRGVEFGISNLVDKCLVDVRSSHHRSYLEMHDLVQEMGRKIVHQESEDPGKRSRLWIPEDVYYVLKNNKGTESIKGIYLNMCEANWLQIRPTAFEKMINLMYIRLYSRGPKKKWLLANEDLTYLPDTLRYLEWEYCPLNSLPLNFNPNNLVQMKLPCSKIEQLWNGDQDVVNLRVMELIGCKNLGKIPSLFGATKLEYLWCDGCESLVELPCMTHLVSLKELRLSGCPITKFPEIESLVELEELHLDGTQIEEVPSFIGSLKKLQFLDMSPLKIKNIPSSIVKLDALEEIDLSNCPNIIELDLNKTPTEEVPSSIPRLRCLKKLLVSNCKSLKSLSELPPWLRILSAGDCTSLERVSYTDHEYQCEGDYVDAFEFYNCFNLNQDAFDNIIAAYPMIRIQSIAKQSAKRLTETILDLHDEEGLDENSVSCEDVVYDLPRPEVSSKFENQSMNSSIVVELGSATSGRFLCFALCLVLDSDQPSKFPAPYYHIHIEYQLKGKDGGSKNFKREWYYMAGNHQKLNGFVLFGQNMVHRDMQYNEASFDFHVVAEQYGADDEVDDHRKVIKGEKCGVHVFHVDAESFVVSDVGSSIINCSLDEDNICRHRSTKLFGRSKSAFPGI